jgi:isopentenyl-diphosphate Delta-isomerase
MEQRKQDHIRLTEDARTAEADPRFYYEPILGDHANLCVPPVNFAGKTMNAPIWVSSMTGGTEKAALINRNLAEACAEFGLGMGLGSCRPLLSDRNRWSDFNLRPILGKDVPFFANLGIAQLEEIIRANNLKAVEDLVHELGADGLIIHVNPLQEWLQPEGDRFLKPPLETIREVLEKVNAPVIVKEVGQGMGPKSIESLLQLPITALDFGAFGGTNFSKLEWLRAGDSDRAMQEPFIRVGHTAETMLKWVHRTLEHPAINVQCQQLIISGGISDFLDGYYFVRTAKIPAVYGQASGFLKHAQGEYSDLKRFVQSQIEGLSMAYACLDPVPLGE